MRHRIQRHGGATLLLALLLIAVALPAMAQYKAPRTPMKYWSKAEFERWLAENERRSLAKPGAHADRTFGLHDGNKIRTLFYNYGSVGRPNTEPSIEWPVFSGHGYAYEFGAMVGAEVVDARGDTIQFFSDAMLDGGDRDPRGGAEVFGWEPLPGFWQPPEDADKGGIAMSNRPESWGGLFTADAEGNRLWPGQFGNGIVTADLESYYVMDDRFNKEFEYYPFPSDSSRRGLGIQVAVRGYQYAAQVAEDIIFFQYEVTNVSEKRLEKVVVGMIGDPHIGGAGDFSDDFAGFDEDANLVFSWDNEGSSNDYGLPWEEVGFLGFKFLQSPGNDEDGADNDGDGIVDESQKNGLDDDHDWNATDADAKVDPNDLDKKSDDIGSDGIQNDLEPGYDPDTNPDPNGDNFDAGFNPGGTEGNGKPDLGEPDYELSDLDESDMLGLTSFTAPVYGTIGAANDDRIWPLMRPGTFGADGIQQNADNIFIFGSGYFAIDADPNDVEKFSIAIIMGQNDQDMRANADVAQFIYGLNFQFTKPPDPPNLKAVAGDGKVTLMWDDIAEASVDPLFGEDFEGYAIYRSTDRIKWGLPITDNRGIKTFERPIAQFDRKDNLKGTHPVGINGIHFYIGDDTGLQYTYVDSNLVNGVTYYYAVTAYDSGSVTLGIPPSESVRIIGGPNVQMVTPNAEAAGYQAPEVTLVHTAGLSSGRLFANVIDRTVITDRSYEVTFDVAPSGKRFSVRDLSADQFVIEQEGGFSLQNHDFDGLRLLLDDVDFVAPIDTTVRWRAGNSNLEVDLQLFSGGIPIARDLEIRWMGPNADTSSLVSPKPVDFQVWNVSDNEKRDFVFFDNDGDGFVTPGDQVIPLVPVNKATWEFSFSAPGDTTIAPINPTQGDVFGAAFTKPFEAGDIYTFATVKPQIDKQEAANELDRIAVVPNPYVAASALETPPPTVFSAGRGERRVDFIHLPTDCSIRIFTLAGEHVVTLDHHSLIFDGTESWNLLSKDGLDVASGIYIYHIEAPGIGERTGRLALVK